MAKKVTIVKAMPLAEPVEITTKFVVVDQSAFCEQMVMRLQAELLGVGCGCRSVAQIVEELRLAGVEVVIEETGGAVYHGGQKPQNN
jgi:hypothetical protein